MQDLSVAVPSMRSSKSVFSKSSSVGKQHCRVARVVPPPWVFQPQQHLLKLVNGITATRNYRPTKVHCCNDRQRKIHCFQNGLLHMPHLAVGRRQRPRLGRMHHHRVQRWRMLLLLAKSTSLCRLRAAVSNHRLMLHHQLRFVTQR